MLAAGIVAFQRRGEPRLLAVDPCPRDASRGTRLPATAGASNVTTTSLIGPLTAGALVASAARREAAEGKGDEE